ncbi:MAG: diaminopimelate epimerase [Gammaproteobacteria bacterium]|nr:diaminopimelate epimerase [Gammaproteobacteria bacterium]NIR81840.1 diaminopimelate epimerase [Gammaproteobacteria bacterium]NIR88672.1 diaminopimelate epimerase [Gammaproteobacteria bacterium]NIU02948.1 diaminopimelate epimerase [Gammaproteobacteria bacterium]NIV50469.1 diaminopimelate epimerase [Gammaproteobacteria bacterium]
MRISFVKMHGLGNDFVVIDARGWDRPLQIPQIRHLAHRRMGVGCDQVLSIEEGSAASEADFALRIYNSDGSRAEQCGNGVRCVALFLRRRGLVQGSRLVLGTGAGPVRCRLQGEQDVAVDMGAPRFEPAEIPFLAQQRASSYALTLNSEHCSIGAVSMGNPHAVLRVDEVSTAPVASLGPAIQMHGRFPKAANVGFMQVIDPSHIRLRVYERGAGETLACGSGACAAVAVGRDQGLLADAVVVDLPGGRLSVTWSGDERQPIWMSGPATWVFEGTIDV